MKMLERAGLRLTACLLALATMSFVAAPIAAQTAGGVPSYRSPLGGVTGSETIDLNQSGQLGSVTVAQFKSKPLPISRQRFLGTSTANAGNTRWSKPFRRPLTSTLCRSN